jgi:PAPA-1-like conserved region
MAGGEASRYEYDMLHAEMTRRRKNLSEKRNEEEKVSYRYISLGDS